MTALTVGAARRRAALLTVTGYDIVLDLKAGLDLTGAVTFRSTTTVRFRCARPGATTTVDLRAGELRSAVLNGRPLPTAGYGGHHLTVPDLAAVNELCVVADMPYTSAGVGLHRSVDPVDGAVYLWAQSFLDHAPALFACFDQPDLKAPVTLWVRAPRDWVVVANAAGTTDGTGRWTFAPTPPIATYLVSFVAGPYHARHRTHAGVPLGFYCRASLAASLDREVDELFEVTAAALDRYQRFFDRRYPFTKYDQVFVPELTVGAMENPGCVLISDDLVFRSAVTDVERERRAVLLAHELAHMWFGGLVTMRWWDDLWLNESFAEYLAVRTVAETTRFRDAWVSFAVGRKVWGYAADQRPSTHPVAPDADGVPDTAAARVAFDGISYAKGAAVLRQLAAWIGEDAFARGLRAYLARHAYGNACLADLLDALGRASGRDLVVWGQAWLRTSGVDTLRADTGPDGTLAVICEPPDAGGPTRRPHRIGVARYRAGHPGERVEVELTGARTPVLLSAGPADVVLLNDGDLTYAKIRVPGGDPGLSTDPLARALVWFAVWDEVRDAERPAGDFLDLVRTELAREHSPAVAAEILQLALVATDTYLPPVQRDPARARVAAAAHVRAADDLVHLLGYVRALPSPAAGAALAGWLAAGETPSGRPLDAELRWEVVRRLAAAGALDEAAVDAEAARDGTAAGQRHAAWCRAALPDPAAKARAWAALLAAPDRSHGLLLATAAGFWQADQAAGSSGYVERFFAEVPATYADRPQATVLRVVSAAYPRFAVDPCTVTLAEAVLDRDDLTPALRRALADGTDDLRRALAARRIASGGADG